MRNFFNHYFVNHDAFYHVILSERSERTDARSEKRLKAG